MRKRLISFARLIKSWIFNKEDWRSLEKFKNVEIGYGTSISMENLDGLTPWLIKIGKDCIFAPKSVVLTHDASLLPFSGKYLIKRTIVGDGVFVGYGAVIMPGVRVGNNVVIGSNSVVTKDVQDNEVVGGIPAKHICTVNELYEKRERHLISPPFNWRDGVTDSDIADLQKSIAKVLQ